MRLCKIKVIVNFRGLVLLKRIKNLYIMQENILIKSIRSPVVFMPCILTIQLKYFLFYTNICVYITLMPTSAYQINTYQDSKMGLARIVPNKMTLRKNM